MQTASRPKCRDPSILSPRLIPRATFVAVNSARKIGVAKIGEVSHGARRRLHGEDVLRLHFGQCARGVIGHALEQHEQIPASETRIRAQRHEVVWVSVRHHAQVGIWTGLPPLAEFHTRDAVDRESVLEGGVETGGTDNGINFSVFAVGSLDACGRDAFNGSGNDVHVLFGEGFEVARARREALAEGREVRKEVLCYVRFLGETVFH